MADVKISGLPASTTPLAGTEVLPIVQSSQTRQVSVSDITAGRAVATQSVTQNGYKTPYTFFSSAIPFIYVSSGSMGNNGALTITGAAQIAANRDAYVYLPANSIQTGSAAGWYYAFFSSTLLATVYNNVYVSGVPTIPSSPTAFSTTGPGAYTQTSGSWIAAQKITLAANSIGINGVLKTEYRILGAVTANSKQIAIAAGAIGNYLAFSSSILSANLFSVYTTLNAGSVSRQTTGAYITGQTPLSPSVGSSTVSFVDTNINFANSHDITFYFNSASNTETYTLGQVNVTVTP